MKYLHTVWSHNDEEHAVFYYYEINDDGYINRHIEIYRDFSYGIASWESKIEIGRIFLSSAKIDNLDDVVNMDQPNIDNFIISERNFNSVWRLLLTMSSESFEKGELDS